MSSRKKRHGAQNDEDDDVEDDHEEKEGEAQATGARRCYYDVMEVPRTASEDDLKQAYRKLARQWHPDKNLHQQDVAEARFKEIQAAYQVLSDPSERAWYDRHRESILRGWDPTASQFDGINLWEFFVSDCYDAFNDGERGFYTVYRKVFDTLAVEEEKYDEDKKRKANQLPSFGNSKSTYAQVSAFYNFWLNFSSSKSFAWKDQYRTMDAENRQIRRLMEKENKKERDKAKRAFVDLVRKFTEFVKKKDKRVIGHLKKQQEERAEKEKLRAEQLKLHQEEHLRNKEILRQAANEHMDSINWKDIDIEALGIDKKSAAQLIGGDRSSKSRARGEDGQDEGDQQEEEEEEEEEEVPEHYCVACKKRFKSDKQWQNHEKSKKHRDAVAALRAELVLDEEIEQFLHDTDLTEEANVNINVEGGDDANTNNDGNVQPEPTATPDLDDEDVDDVVEDEASIQEMLKAYKVSPTTAATTPASSHANDYQKPDAPANQSHNKATDNEEEEEEEEEEDDEDEPSSFMPSNNMFAFIQDGGDDDDNEDDEDDEEDIFLQQMARAQQAKKTAAKKQAKQQKKKANLTALLQEDRETMKKQAEANSVSIEPESPNGDGDTATSDDDNEEKDNDRDKPTSASSTPASSSDKKKKSRRRKKDKQQPAPSASSGKNNTGTKNKKGKKAVSDDDGDDDEFNPSGGGNQQWGCRICKKSFAARNALFQHLKESGHARAE